MKEIIKRNWKKVVSFVLAVALVAAYLPTNMTEVKAADVSTTLTFSSGYQYDETQLRANLTVGDGVTITNGANNYNTGNNAFLLDGIRKTGLAYHCLDEAGKTILLLMPLNDIFGNDAGITTANLGQHSVVIPAGTVVALSDGTNLNITNDVLFEINGSTVQAANYGNLTYVSGSLGQNDGSDACCYINMSISDVLNTGSGWYGTNTIEVDGTRVSSSNIYYVAPSGTDVTLRIRYSAIKEALGVETLSGCHAITIPENVLIPNAGNDQGATFVNREAVSFKVDFDNNTVTEIILADVTHNSYTLQRSAIEDNADANSWFRFTSATSDSLTSWATNPEWTIVDGGFCLNGEEISADLVEFISIGNGVYHVGLSALLNAGNVINSGDYITLNAMVQDTTDSGYYVKFETVYFQYDTNGDQKWTIQTEEPGNKDVQFALTSAGAQDGDGRYLLTVSVSGATLPEHSTGWDNTALLDGVEKTGTGENSGFAYSYVNSSTMNILLKYDYVEAGATTASTIGKHRFVIPKGTVIPFGTITMELSEDFDVTIQGDSVIETPQADVTHNSYTLQRSAIEDNADANSWFRFTSNVSDTLEQGKEWSIVDGGFSFNGETISADYVEFIKITDTIYHIGLSALLNSGVTIESKDYITLNAMVQDTTDSGYYVKFETVYFQYDTNGDQKWTIQTEEPGNKDVQFTLTSAGAQDGDGRYLLTVSVSGATLPEHSTGWDNTALLDGVEKTGTGENSGFAYSYVNSSTMNILLKYDYVEAGATTASTIGKHRFVIPKGTVIPFGTITMELSEDFDVTIQGDSVIETPQADVTHNSYNLYNSAVDDGANATSYFRFTSATADVLTENTNWTIVDGGFELNGVEIPTEYVEFIKITDTIYHIGLSALLESGTTIQSKDYITLNAMVQDTTDSSYYVRFETVYFQYDTNGDQKWTVQMEEPYIGIPEPEITHTYSSVPDAFYGNNGNFLRFHVDTTLDTLGSQSQELVILDGGLYKNGTLLAEDTYNIQKPWNDGYHIGLDQGKLTFDVGDRLTMDVLVVAADDTTAYNYPIKFEVTFECTSSSEPNSVTSSWGWSVINEDNDISFIKLDTNSTYLRDDGMWLIYLYTNRVVGVEAGTTVKIQINGVTYEATLLGMGNENRMYLAVSNENLSIGEATTTITIPCQPNVVFDGNVATINIAKEFTFYLYSNGSFGLLGDSDGTVAGNVNGDAVIGSQDLVCLKKYLADHTDVNHTEHTLKSGGADANENGYIEETDIIKLYEYILEGWTVDGMSYEAGTQLPVYLDDEDIQLAAYQGPRTLTIDGIDDLTSIEEEFRKYKEAGFNTIIHEADCAYSSQLGSDMWYKLKQYMRMAQKYDLDVLISSQELNNYLLNGNEGNGTEDPANWQYSIDRLIAFMNGTENNIVSGSTYGNDTEVVVFDNFAGFVMADEPDNDSAIMDRYKTAKAYLDEQYSSAFGGRKPVLFYSLESYEAEAFTTIDGLYLFGTWLTSKKVETAYGTHSTFLANYGSITGSATIDRYPFRVDDMDGKLSPQDPHDGGGANYLDAGWLYQLELLATQGKANAFTTGITLQSSAFTHPSDARRKINSVADVKFEVYSALAYGMSSVNYFTYNLPANPPEGEEFTSAICGVNTAYNAVQSVNNEISKFDYVFNDYDWVSTKYYGTSSDGLFNNLASNTSLSNVTSVEANNAAIVSHMYDYEKYLDGYWVVNVTDPEDNLSNKVTVTFDTAYTKAIAFVDGEKKIVNLTNGVYEAQLGAGEGVFIIPLKIAE